MAIVKQYTRRMDDAGSMEKVQSLTAASTATIIVNYGVTVISSTQAKTFQMAAPRAGLRKSLAVVSASTDDITTIDGNGATIAGSTAFTVDGPGGVELVGTSTGAWALLGSAGLVALS